MDGATGVIFRIWAVGGPTVTAVLADIVQRVAMTFVVP